MTKGRFGARGAQSCSAIFSSSRRKNLTRANCLGRGVHEVPEKMTRPGVLVTVADTCAQQSIEVASHEGQLQITVDFHRHGRRERIHMKEIDPIFDVVLNEHSLEPLQTLPLGTLMVPTGSQKAPVSGSSVRSPTTPVFYAGENLMGGKLLVLKVGRGKRCGFRVLAPLQVTKPPCLKPPRSWRV
jgi:hypothetical protein